jgi:hypothetical protein
MELVSLHRKLNGSFLRLSVPDKVILAKASSFWSWRKSQAKFLRKVSRPKSGIFHLEFVLLIRNSMNLEILIELKFPESTKLFTIKTKTKKPLKNKHRRASRCELFTMGEATNCYRRSFQFWSFAGFGLVSLWESTLSLAWRLIQKNIR